MANAIPLFNMPPEMTDWLQDGIVMPRYGDYYWESTGAETYTNSNGAKLIDFCEAMAKVATEFNCPVMNGYRALGINTINDAAFSADGTHLNDYGRKAFGEFMGGNLIAPVPAQST